MNGESYRLKHSKKKKRGKGLKGERTLPVGLWKPKTRFSTGPTGTTTAKTGYNNLYFLTRVVHFYSALAKVYEGPYL